MNAPKLIYYRDLVLVLLSKELKVRYKNTVLGYAWSVLNPLAFALVFFLLFRVFMRIPMENYALFLIAGLFPWQWFQNSISTANTFFLNDRTLIKRVRFPRCFLAVAGVLNHLVHFVISIPVILAFMLYYKTWPTLDWLWAVPALLLIQLVFTYGVSIAIATCNLFFRDLERLTMIATMLWLYLSPVLYPASMVPERWRWVLYANPIAPMIVCWRSLFLAEPLSLPLLAAGAGWAAVSFLVGTKIYGALEWRFAEVV